MSLAATQNLFSVDPTLAAANIPLCSAPVHCVLALLQSGSSTEAFV